MFIYSLHSFAGLPSTVILYKKMALIALAFAGSAATRSLIVSKIASLWILVADVRFALTIFKSMYAPEMKRKRKH